MQYIKQQYKKIKLISKQLLYVYYFGAWGISLRLNRDDFKGFLCGNSI